jgi:Domain of Unknown Function (DUF1080)
MEIFKSVKSNALKLMVVAGAVSAVSIWAQPATPTTPDYLCSATPGVLGVNDTMPNVFNDSGFTDLFDGSSWKGWWQNCQSGHSTDKVNGAVWKLSPENKAIYSTQRGNSGGLLLTKKKYGNYEVQFDIWPSYGNDGGWFNRVSVTGVCYQTVMDYIQASAFGATWGEGGYTGRDLRPFAFNGNDSTLTIPGNTGTQGWTAWTATQNPTSFGCSAAGCNQADWRKLWNLHSWNTMRIRFYGGLTAGGKVHMFSWFRKDATAPWVPLWADSLAHTDPASFMGLQVHGGGRFGGEKGNWYRNIMMRYLDDNGKILNIGSVGVAPKLAVLDNDLYEIKAVANTLVGRVDMDHEITVSNANGRVLETFTGRAGKFSHALSAKTSGLLYVDIKTSIGSVHQQVNQVRE